MTNDKRLEAVCRQMCRENGVYEGFWECYKDTTAARMLVLRWAFRDLWEEIKKAIRWPTSTK